MLQMLLRTLTIQKLSSAPPPGPHDVGHADVAAGRGEFSLRSLDGNGPTTLELPILLNRHYNTHKFLYFYYSV